jgi:hypothetical protein
MQSSRKRSAVEVLLNVALAAVYQSMTSKQKTSLR